MKRTKKILVWVLSLLVACVPVSGAAAVDLQKQVDDAKQEGEAIEQQKATAESQLSSLNSQLSSLNATITQTQTDIENKLADITAAEEELTQAKLDEENQYNAMKLRIKYMYETGQDTMLAIILEADDIADMINKTEYVSMLSTYDRNMLKEYQETVQTVSDTEEKLQEEYTSLTALESQLTSEQDNIKTLITDQEAVIANLEQQLGANSEEVAALQKQLNSYNASVAASKAAANSAGKANYSGNAGSSVVSGNGQFTNPCPSGSLSSGFGYRSFDNSFHKGIDLAAGAGSPIYAAADGTVMIAGYSASAGNWIVINHGNGIVTKYMHCSVLYVHAGATVQKGQNIAGVGTTGYSTGNHLHFQVEVNGTAVNPYLYF